MAHFLLLWLEKIFSQWLLSYGAEHFGSWHVKNHFWAPQGASGFPPGFFWGGSQPLRVFSPRWGQDFSYWQKQYRIPFLECSSFAQSLERGEHWSVQPNWFWFLKPLSLITFSNICEGFLLFWWLHSTVSNSSGFSHWILCFLSCQFCDINSCLNEAHF